MTSFEEWAHTNMIGTGSNYQAAKLAWDAALASSPPARTREELDFTLKCARDKIIEWHWTFEEKEPFGMHGNLPSLDILMSEIENLIINALKAR